jgi:hypothetical protein
MLMCWQVIKLREHQGRQDDSEDMQTLLAFCLAHCPDDQVCLDPYMQSLCMTRCFDQIGDVSYLSWWIRCVLHLLYVAACRSKCIWTDGRI